MFFATLMITVRCDECEKRLSMETDVSLDRGLDVTFTVRSMTRQRGWGTRKRGDDIQDACPEHKEE